MYIHIDIQFVITYTITPTLKLCCHVINDVYIATLCNGGLLYIIN